VLLLLAGFQAIDQFALLIRIVVQPTPGERVGLLARRPAEQGVFLVRGWEHAHEPPAAIGKVPQVLAEGQLAIGHVHDRIAVLPQRRERIECFRVTSYRRVVTFLRDVFSSALHHV
jgi:hypothetical protein